MTLAVFPPDPLLQLMLELATSTVSYTKTRKKSHIIFFFPTLILAETLTVVLCRISSVVPIRGMWRKLLLKFRIWDLVHKSWRNQMEILRSMWLFQNLYMCFYCTTELKIVRWILENEHNHIDNDSYFLFILSQCFARVK